MNKTVVPSLNTVERHWYVVDAENQCLGRLATEVASVLRGKNKPTYAPHADSGNHVIIINIDQLYPDIIVKKYTHTVILLLQYITIYTSRE